MTPFQIRLRRRGISKEELIADMQRVGLELQGAPVTRVAYDQRGEFGATTIIRNFGTWNSALEIAGLQLSNRQNIPDEELFENLANVWKKIGRQPYGREMSDKDMGSVFSTGTYEKRFGSWNGALIAFSSHLVGNSTSSSVNPQAKVLTKRTPRDINWRLRAKILIRDGCICQMCGANPQNIPETILHVDHRMPWSRGGETVEENLQTLCAKCNIGKSDEIWVDE